MAYNKAACEKHAKTIAGVISSLFNGMQTRNKLKDFGALPFTKGMFKHWLLDNGFKILYTNWTITDYNKWYKPSVDRLDDFIGYTFSNMRLVTWKVNRDKQSMDITKGRSTSGVLCKMVIQYTKDGIELNRFYSQNEAARFTGINNTNISSCCAGRRPFAGGFVWKKGER